MIDWKIKINHHDNWWKISSSSPLSGSLNPGESESVAIEINRTGKAEGAYEGGFVVEAHATGYRFTKEVTLIMEVGESPEPVGPELVNVNTNTGNTFDRLVLSFNRPIKPSFANDKTNYTITPTIEIFDVTIADNEISLTTAQHTDDITYEINIDSLRDTRDVKSTNLIGEYQFYHCCAGFDLNVSGSTGKYEWDVALPNKRMYRDRSYTLGQIPEEYTGCAMLKTSCEDVTIRHGLNVSFTINCDDAKVILAYDPRRASWWSDEWLESAYTKLSTTLPVNGIDQIDHFDLYESNHTYQPGQTVSFYENGNQKSYIFMYFALVKGNKPTIDISGKVTYHSFNQVVPNASINLTGEITDSISTDPNGRYDFTALEKGLDCAIAPSKTDDISSMTIMMHDAALTARIANQMSPDPTKFQRLAADVNRDSLVSMEDATMIAMHAVGLRPNPESYVGQWVFQPAYRFFTEINSQKTDQNFTAIILGDVDGNWSPADPVSEKLAPKPQMATFADYWETQNNQLIIPFKSDAGDAIFSFEITLNYDPSVLRFKELRPTSLSHHFQRMVNEFEKGRLRLGGFGPQAITAQAPYAELLFDIIGEEGAPGEIELEHCSINGEIGGAGSATYIVGAHLPKIPKQHALYQTYPNPFNPETVIHYELANTKPERTVIQVYNIKGELVKTLVDKVQTAGHYTISWYGDNQVGQQVAGGMYLLHARLGDVSLKKKMVRVR